MHCCFNPSRTFTYHNSIENGRIFSGGEKTQKEMAMKDWWKKYKHKNNTYSKFETKSH